LPCGQQLRETRAIKRQPNGKYEKCEKFVVVEILFALFPNVSVAATIMGGN